MKTDPRTVAGLTHPCYFGGCFPASRASASSLAKAVRQASVPDPVDHANRNARPLEAVRRGSGAVYPQVRPRRLPGAPPLFLGRSSARAHKQALACARGAGLLAFGGGGGGSSSAAAAAHLVCCTCLWKERSIPLWGNSLPGERPVDARRLKLRDASTSPTKPPCPSPHRSSVPLGTTTAGRYRRQRRRRRRQMSRPGHHPAAEEMERRLRCAAARTALLLLTLELLP